VFRLIDIYVEAFLDVPKDAVQWTVVRSVTSKCHACSRGVFSDIQKASWNRKVRIPTIPNGLKKNMPK
jgi:hypothetical protein